MIQKCDLHFCIMVIILNKMGKLNHICILSKNLFVLTPSISTFLIFFFFRHHCFRSIHEDFLVRPVVLFSEASKWNVIKQTMYVYPSLKQTKILTKVISLEEFWIYLVIFLKAHETKCSQASRSSQPLNASWFSQNFASVKSRFFFLPVAVVYP